MNQSGSAGSDGAGGGRDRVSARAPSFHRGSRDEAPRLSQSLPTRCVGAAARTSMSQAPSAETGAGPAHPRWKQQLRPTSPTAGFPGGGERVGSGWSLTSERNPAVPGMAVDNEMLGQICRGSWGGRPSAPPSLWVGREGTPLFPGPHPAPALRVPVRFLPWPPPLSPHQHEPNGTS